MQPRPTTLPSRTTPIKPQDELAGRQALDQHPRVGQEEGLGRDPRVLQEAGEPLAAALAPATFGACAVWNLTGDGRQLAALAADDATDAGGQGTQVAGQVAGRFGGRELL